MSLSAISSPSSSPSLTLQGTSASVPTATSSETSSAFSIDAQQAVTPPAETQMDDAVTRINQAMQTISPGLEFSVDQDSQRTIVRVVDQGTGDVIRQMPSAEALEIASALDKVQGLLISLRA